MVKHCENCKCEEVEASKKYAEETERVNAALKIAKTFSDSELIYAAFARCKCGAGMAYPRGIGIGGYWDCSAILTGAAVPSGQPGSVEHEAQLPFAFYEIKSENQPSAGGATTRSDKV